MLLVPAVVNKEIAYDDAYKRSQAEIRKAIPLAEELGVKIACENVWNHFLLSPLEAARYVDEFKSPAIGWHFDVGNILNYGWPEQWIRILGPRIQKFHIKEFSRKKRDSEGLWKGFDVKLLEGDNNWPAVMKAVDDIGYHGWVMTEQPGGDTPEGLKDLADRLGKILLPPMKRNRAARGRPHFYETQPEKGHLVCRGAGQDAPREIPGRQGRRLRRHRAAQPFGPG